MSNILPTKTSEISAAANPVAAFSGETISIRVSPNNYFIVLFLTTFITAWLVYLERDYLAAALFAASWIIVPLLAWTDRVTFDGRRIVRRGIPARVWAWTNATKYRLKISDIEQVESQALRALKRGGNVFYRYRTTLQGKGLKFALASGGEDYRRMIRQILPLLPENALDNRSIELRDYLLDPKEILMKAAFAKIPSTGVLESSLNEFQNPAAKSRARQHFVDNTEKADDLRRLANELRLAGYLLQALETFRRALLLNRRDAWLIFDFARCLNSFAGSEKSGKLRRKSFAALRLAEKRGASDGELLARIGESYFQYGDWKRAAAVFKKASEPTETNFRAARGSAEIAMREGKIAYVIQHFAVANRLAETPALRRWTQNETNYFSLLNADEDYMEMEISRVKLVENLEIAKKTCLKIALAGVPLIIIGLIADPLMTNIGWTISCFALLFWISLMLGARLFSTRVPLDFADED